MKPIDKSEILGIADYETIREHFRARVIGEKKHRRVAVGPNATATFENRDTVLLQIQEMIRTERITREAAIQHEIDTYNQLVPGDAELSCTVMIEIADPVERDAFLVAARGFERHVSLVVGGDRARAKWDPALELEDQTPAVHYFKFALSERAIGALRSATRADATITHVELEIDHPAYRARATLPAETIVALGEDLER
jgi:hypothetical protein